MLYLGALGLLERLSGASVLHFAPERHLARTIARAAPLRYVKCDIDPGSTDTIRVDIERIPFSEGEFDLVIANHVLEHASDDVLAASEVARVLKPGGLAILQTPYSAAIDTTREDPGINEPRRRLEAFGQEDHVRLHGNDIYRRIANAGLVSRKFTHEQLLPGRDPARFGLNANEPLMLFSKPIDEPAASRFESLLR